MSHRNAITYGNCRKYNRHPARFCNAKLNCLSDLIKIHMTGHDLII